MLALLAASLYTDLRYGKVRNHYTLPAVGLGLATNALLGGWPAAQRSLVGAGVILVLALTVANFAHIGPGDLKLLMAVGALKGIGFLAVALLATALCGGVLALALLVRRKRVPDVNTLAWAVYVNAAGKGALAGMLDAGKLPYSVPIALGSCIALFWG